MQSLFDLFLSLLPPIAPDPTSNKIFVPNLKKSAAAVDKCLSLIKFGSKTISLGLSTAGLPDGKPSRGIYARIIGP
jgi:hypothetical protein